MFCNRNKIINIWQESYAIVHHSDKHVVPWCTHRPFAFEFNKVLMAG